MAEYQPFSLCRGKVGGGGGVKLPIFVVVFICLF